MATITLRRSVPSPEGSMFGDEATITTSRSGAIMKEHIAKLVAALAYGDRIKNGDEVLVSDNSSTRLITVDFADA